MDERVLIFAPPRDGRLTGGFLGDRGFACLACASWEEFVAELHAGAGTAILAGEFLSIGTVEALEIVLAAQPPWSDLPLVIVGGDDRAGEQERAFERLGNVSLLQRPVSIDTLASTVRSALRARRRQYQIRDLLDQRDEADRRKDEFLAMLAHELRNPLAPLRTGVQLLRLRPSEEIAERTRALMERQVVNLSRLVDDLLDVSRLTRGKVRLTTRRVDLRESCRQVVDAFRVQAVEKGVSLDVRVPPEPLWAEADAVRLEQMIGNLLANALKFTLRGGTVRVTAEPAPDGVAIRVRDTGVGIPAHQLPHVFDLFSQADRTLDRSRGGLGIGLTVVRSLAELHGGSAEIHSGGEGHGTEAVLRLPSAREGEPRDVPGTGAPGRAASRRRVLIIEDHVDAAETLASFLEEVGHEVVVARDGRAGVEAAFRHRPEVVVCDIGLPGMDGYEVARALRASPRFESCLLIALTGYGEVADRERARRAGFTYHLTKPADALQVAQLVARPADAWLPGNTAESA
jgi:two-component system, sensor histidine kinase